MKKKIFVKDDFICDHTIFFRNGIIAKRFKVKENERLFYWATTDGKVFNESGYEMKQFDPGTGYRMVKIGGVKITVHRLLGLLFLKNDEQKETIDHIDRNKRNNHLSNLRWATYGEQATNRRPRTDSRSVVLSNDHTVIYFKSMKDASRFLKRNPASIQRAITHQLKINDYIVK